MIKFRNFLLIVIPLLFLSGCTFRVIDFTLISTKNVNVPQGAKKMGKRVTGEDCVVVFIFPLGQIHMKEAVDQAIESAGPEYDALIDGVVSHVNRSFLFGQV